MGKMDVTIARRPALLDFLASPGRVPAWRYDGRAFQTQAMRHAVLDHLLAGFLRERASGIAALRPLWAREATHRAAAIIRLVGRLGRVSASSTMLGVEADRRIAEDIAGIYTAAAAWEDRAMVTCSPALRDLAVNLVDLLGAAAGRITLELRVLNAGAARLKVSDDGIGCDGMCRNTVPGIAGMLAELLQSELVYASAGGGTIATIGFPLPPRH
jgi:hypothetical protein